MLEVSARWNMDFELSWPWLRWWVVVWGCSSSSLRPCFHVLKGVRRPAVIVTVTGDMDMLYAHIIETRNRSTPRVCMCVCVFLCDLVQAFDFLCVYHLDVWGRTQLKFKPGPPLHPTTTLPPLQPLQSWPWLILLSFTFLSEIYYLLPWLVFYGLMTSNRSHHQGQLQLHPLCLCSSMSNLVCCLCLFIYLFRATSFWISFDDRWEILKTD